MLRQLLCSLAAVLILFPCAALAADYDHMLQAKDMEVHWRVDGEQIHLKLSAKTTGWVGIGFGPENAMKGADIIIGAVKKGKVRIEDHYGDRKRGHSSDKKLGGENHVLNPQGMEEDGVTTISFTLPLKADEKWDKAIDPSTMSRIMVGYGSGRDSFKAGHKYRGVYDVNFATGETKKVK